MAKQVVDKKGKKFQAWNWGTGESPDNNEELMFLIKNKGVMLDPDCSWRAIAVENEKVSASGDAKATLLYNIVRDAGKIIDATDIRVVTKETFESEYNSD